MCLHSSFRVVLAHTLIFLILVGVASSEELAKVDIGEAPPVDTSAEEKRVKKVVLVLPVDDDDSEFAPELAVLSCSDMPVPPHKALQVPQGSIVVVSNMGNVVSIAGLTPNSIEIGSLEYAVSKMGIKNIIVLGHKNCPFIKSVIEDPKGKGHTPAIHQVVLKAVTESAKSPTDDPAVFFQNVVYHNIKNSMDRLKSDEFILADLIKSGELSIIGAIYDPDTGQADDIAE